MGSLAWMLSVAAGVCLFVCLQPCRGAGWEYTGSKGVDHWAANYPGQCDGQRQSPIDLTSSIVRYDSSLKLFQLHRFDDVEGVNWTLSNNGHTAQVTYETGELMVTGGSLNGDYKVAQFHFHWGSDSTKGSEHTINNSSYPMEVHVVCFNKIHGNLGNAVAVEPNGLAVLGFFFEISPYTNPTIQKIIDYFSHIRHAGNSTRIPPFPLNNLLAGMSEYYRYQGGLTTPTCNQVVTWTVFKATIKITEAQMNKFRELQDSMNSNMVNNYRPVQKLYGRDIRASFDAPEFASASAGLVFNSVAVLSSLALSLWLRL